MLIRMSSFDEVSCASGDDDYIRLYNALLFFELKFGHYYHLKEIYINVRFIYYFILLPS